VIHLRADDELYSYETVEEAADSLAKLYLLGVRDAEFLVAPNPAEVQDIIDRAADRVHELAVH
jgi:hypothetical protein